MDLTSKLVLPIPMGALVVAGSHPLDPILCTISRVGAKRPEP